MSPQHSGKYLDGHMHTHVEVESCDETGFITERCESHHKGDSLSLLLFLSFSHSLSVLCLVQARVYRITDRTPGGTEADVPFLVIDTWTW